MMNKYIMDADYDFTSGDLETPDAIVQELCGELANVTGGYVQGYISEYDGEIESYNVPNSVSNMSRVLSSLYYDTKVNVQDSLGAIGELEFKYEFYISSKYIDNFKFRVFFIEFGMGGYPVKVVLEQGIADEILGEEDADYIFLCNSGDEFQKLLIQIFGSKRMKSVVQDMIHVANRKLKMAKTNR